MTSQVPIGLLQNLRTRWNADEATVLADWLDEVGLVGTARSLRIYAATLDKTTTDSALRHNAYALVRGICSMVQENNPPLDIYEWFPCESDPPTHSPPIQWPR